MREVSECNCSNCGSRLLSSDAYCGACGAPVVLADPNRINRNFRQHFALTFVFALLTGIFWYMQRYAENSTISLFSPLSSLLSVVARVSFCIAFAVKSSNWLAVSAFASITSLFLGVIGAIPFGYYYTDWATQLTWLFSLSTFIIYFIQARSYEIRPFAKTRR